MQMFKKLVLKLNNKQKKAAAQGMVNPIDGNYSAPKNKFLDELSLRAVEMYEKECDIKHFSKLVTSDNESHLDEELMQNLFNEGVIDPFEDEKLAQLADNSRFLKDLGLTD